MNTNMSFDALISAETAAQRLGIPTKKVYDLIAEGVLPAGVAVRVGRQIRVDLAALDRWIAAGGAGFSGGWRKSQPPISRFQVGDLVEHSSRGRGTVISIPFSRVPDSPNRRVWVLYPMREDEKDEPFDEEEDCEFKVDCFTEFVAARYSTNLCPVKVLSLLERRSIDKSEMVSFLSAESGWSEKTIAKIWEYHQGNTNQ